MEPGILPGSFQSGHARAFARMTRVSSSQTRATTPRPAARTMKSDTPIRRPPRAGYFPGHPDAGRLAFWRPSGPPESPNTGGILPPIACARWTTREPGILARLSSNSGEDAPLRGCDVARAPDLRITVIGAPVHSVVRAESSAGKDAGGALVRRATHEPAGCGGPVRHPAARRAARKQASHCPDFHTRSPHEAGAELASPA